MKIDQELLNRLNGDNEAFEAFADLIIQEVLKTIPFVVENIARQAVEMRKQTKKFYEKNSDLVNHKKTVAKVMEGLEASNPGLSFEDVINKAGPESRKLINSLSNIKSEGKKTLTELDNTIGHL